MRHVNRSAAAAYAAGVGAAVVLFSAAFGRKAVGRVPDDPPARSSRIGSGAPEAVIQKWPKAERAAAGAMIDKYGEPSSFTKDALVWLENGPWLKTVVSRGSGSLFFGQRDKNYLVQTVAYPVPIDKIEDLKLFDGRLEVDESRDRLSSHSESEPMNFLALNLADEIVTGKRGVKDARAFYAKTERLSKAGKSSAYTAGFLFPRRTERDLRIDDYLDDEYEGNMMP